MTQSHTVTHKSFCCLCNIVGQFYSISISKSRVTGCSSDPINMCVKVHPNYQLDIIGCKTINKAYFQLPMMISNPKCV